MVRRKRYFPKKQTVTLRREGERGHFWAGGVVFASQFEESSFDMSLSQQVLSAIVVPNIPPEFVTAAQCVQYYKIHAPFENAPV